MFSQADTLYQKHYYDVIVFFHSCVPGRETDHHIFDYYGTPGSGRLFLKDAENEKSQSHGATVLRALKRFYYGAILHLEIIKCCILLLVWI